jgi:hypothetical protein
MKTILSAAILAAAASQGFASVPADTATKATVDAASATSVLIEARRGRGADDPAGHQRRGRGADDPAGHASATGTAPVVGAPYVVQARRGADDPAGHVRGGKGADDPAGHASAAGVAPVVGQPYVVEARRGRGADDPVGHG